MRRAAVFMLLAVASSLPAQSQPTQPPISATGTEAFRAVVASYGLKPLKEFRELKEAPPERTLIIAFRGAGPLGVPYSDQLDKLHAAEILPEGLLGFLETGGAALVATDQSTEHLGWAESLGVRVDGRKVFAGFDSEISSYRGNRECPYVRAADKSNGHVNLLAGLPPRTVATNRPSFLYKPSTEFDDLAFLSSPCRLEGS